MDKLATKYEKDFEFLESTWANIGIADVNLYKTYAADIYKNRALNALNKSLSIKPNYGIPYAVKMLLYMVEYQRTKELNERVAIKNSILEIFVV